MKGFAARSRNAESFTQVALEAYALENQWARRLLGGKWERHPGGWMWVGEFEDNGLERQEFERGRVKRSTTIFNGIKHYKV